MTYIAIPTKAAQLVRVQIEEKDDVFTATSPDLNIFVSGRDLGEKFNDVLCRSIREHFQAMGQTPPMIVIRVNHPDRNTGYWHFAAIPQCLLDSREHNEMPEGANG